MEDWAEIRRLYRSEKLSQAAIARQLGLSRNTVAKALRSESPPRYERAPVVTSAWALVEPAVRVLLGQYPSMPATVIAKWRDQGTHALAGRSECLVCGLALKVSFETQDSTQIVLVTE